MFPINISIVLLLIQCFHLNSIASADNNVTLPPISVQQSQKLKAAELTRKAFALHGQGQNVLHMWKQILELDPRSIDARFQAGFILIANKATQEEGFQLLEQTFDSSFVDHPIPQNTPQSFVLAQLIGRYRWQENEFPRAQHFLTIAKNSNPEPDVCTEVMIASMSDPFPESIEAADESMDLYHQRMDAILEWASQTSDGRLQINPNWMKVTPGAANDAYVHCLCSLFNHSFYYRADSRSGTSKHFQVASKVWPELLYTSPRLLEEGDSSLELKSKPKLCEDRKIRLGIASGHFSEKSSVAEDFKGVLKNLDRGLFEITYIFFAENALLPSSVMLDKRDKLLTVSKNMDDSKGSNKWLEKPRKDIEALNLDILLYLDLTMSTFAHRMGMSRLAPVQAVSHGHPLTSGFPRSIMNYYISWGAAELPYEQAQNHYTEELKLLPATSLHQYYYNRIEDGHSVVDGMAFKHLVTKGRSSFPNLPIDGNWYLSMQKPFKLHPEFDALIAGILRRDPHAKIILHEENKESNKKIFYNRLSSAGCDMKKIFFIPAQPHHKLLALYELSDVILDSYPAGGCTTTREVLELGKVVVTLPAKYLGSRWSQGYYSILGDDRLNDLVVARSANDYIEKASRLGKDKKLRKEAENMIKAKIPKLFHSMEAVHEWTKILLDIAPLNISKPGAMCSEKDTAHLANAVKTEF